MVAERPRWQEPTARLLQQRAGAVPERRRLGRRRLGRRRLGRLRQNGGRGGRPTGIGTAGTAGAGPGGPGPGPLDSESAESESSLRPSLCARACPAGSGPNEPQPAGFLPRHRRGFSRPGAPPCPWFCAAARRTPPFQTRRAVGARTRAGQADGGQEARPVWRRRVHATLRCAPTESGRSRRGQRTCLMASQASWI